MEDVKCQVCGKTVSLEIWNQAYEQFKHSRDHAFICPTCQARIRAEAKDSQGH